MKHNNQTSIHLGEHGAASIYHVRFQSGDLVILNFQPEIPKPIEYSRWRTKRKETFLAGRLAIRLAQKNLGLAHFDVLRGVDGAPIWPSYILGSVSHTDNEAIALIIEVSNSKLGGIGVDLEKIQSAAQLEEDSLIGKPEEFNILTSLGFKKDLARLLLFSVKESVYKALYPRVGKFFDFLDVSLIAEQQGIFSLVVNRNLSNQISAGFQLNAGYKKVNDTLITYAYD